MIREQGNDFKSVKFKSVKSKNERKKKDMDISIDNVMKDELYKSNQTFRDLVQQHQSYEKRLTELAHLNYPNEDEVIEETTIKKKKLLVKDEIYAMMMQQHSGSH